MMRLVYLPVNAAWVFLFGDSPLRLESEPMFYSHRDDALSAANRHGLEVTASGLVRSA